MLNMITLRASINSAVTATWICIFGAIPAAAEDLSALYDELATSTPETADYIIGKIQGEWAKSGSPAMDLLLARGRAALNSGEAGDAVGHLSALVDHAPDFVQGHVSRAKAYAALGLIGPALDDLAVALTLDPRHFEALEGLGLILQDSGQREAARDVWAEVQRLNPYSTVAVQALETLAQEAGESEA